MGDRAHLNGRLPGGFSSVIPADRPIRSAAPAAKLAQRRSDGGLLSAPSVWRLNQASSNRHKIKFHGLLTPGVGIIS